MTVSNCLFCRIVAGEIPSDTVHSDNSYIAIRDIAPKAETHVLVIPRTHARDLNAWLDSDVGDAADATTQMLRFCRATAEKLGVGTGYRLITNVGPAAGQEVFHLHWHILADRTVALPGFATGS